MKKTLIVISALLLVFSVGLTACGNKNIIVDDSGYSYKVVTKDDGSMLQDKWGRLIIEKTDADGNNVTEPYNFPKKITNKSNSKIENAVVSINVPSGWEVSKETSFIRIKHKGKCVKSGAPACQLEFGFTENKTLQEAYNTYLNQTAKINTISDLISDITEFEVTLMGKNAKAISYRIDSESMDVFYFCIDDGEPMIEVTVFVYDKCYDRDSIVELINSCATVKELPTDDAVTETTIPFTKLAEKPTAENDE